MASEPIYLHYGNAEHRPLSTVRFTGTGAKLLRLIREAQRDGTPLRIQVGDEVEDANDFKKRVYGRRSSGGSAGIDLAQSERRNLRHLVAEHGVAGTSRVLSESDYEQREAHEFQRQLREAERNPARRADCDQFRQQLAADPGLVAERIRWLLNGSYGYGAMQASKRVLASPRMNRVAWLVQTVGALEWRCPARSVVAAWKKLSPVEKKALDAAVRREIRNAEREA